LNRVVVDQGIIQRLMWQEFNLKLQQEEVIEKVKDVLKEFPHSELTGWNV
jgi:hypothetical protein